MKIRAMNESSIRDKLALSLNGQVEASSRSGRIDVLTETEIIEVKEITNWKSALGQILAYGIDYPSHAKRLHLFSSGLISNRRQQEIIDVAMNFDVVVTFEMAHHKKEKLKECDEMALKRVSNNQSQASNKFKLTEYDVEILKSISQKAKGLMTVIE